MTTFYTVDRLNTLREKQVIKLVRHTDIKPAELQLHVDELFINGLTRHGDSYFLKNSSTPGIINSQIEILAEYVRRANFSSCPSRFQAVFASGSIADAEKFISIYGGGAVWEVSCESYFKADMNLLKNGNSVLVHSYFLNKYWKGESSENPFWEFLLVSPVTVIKKIR